MLTSGTNNLRLHLLSRPDVFRDYPARFNNCTIPDIYWAKNAGISVYDNVAPEMRLPGDPSSTVLTMASMRPTYGHTLIYRQGSIAYDPSPDDDAEPMDKTEPGSQPRFVVQVNMIKHPVHAPYDLG